MATLIRPRKAPLPLGLTFDTGALIGLERNDLAARKAFASRSTTLEPFAC